MKRICAIMSCLCILILFGCSGIEHDVSQGESSLNNSSIMDISVDSDIKESSCEETSQEEETSKEEEVSQEEEASQEEESSQEEEASQEEELSKDEESSQEEETSQEDNNIGYYKPMNYDFMKAVWLSQFDLENVYKNGDAQRDEEEFISLMTVILDNLKNDGYNTVMVQVRPYADSFYPSEVYPISGYVSGKYGIESIYDPFEIIIALAHERELSVHAWINPMRAMKSNEIVDVPDKYLIKQWYNDQNKYGNYIVDYKGRLYLNPAYAEVRKLISDGAKEVCEKYNIDGVHMDDYFYPTTEASFDSTAYGEYKANGGKNSLNNFRYENLNLMVSGIYNSLKELDENLVFGISPAGNINTTYQNYYTDVYKWCSEEGFIDYICPQIYFGLEHGSFDFKKVYNTWNFIIKTDKVKLIVGMTLGKAQSGVDNYAGSGKNEWSENKDVIKRCFQWLDSQSDCFGISMFSYQYMYDPVTGTSVAETQQERDNGKSALAELGN